MIMIICLSISRLRQLEQFDANDDHGEETGDRINDTQGSDPDDREPINEQVSIFLNNINFIAIHKTVQLYRRIKDILA